ncbi:MAG: DUF4145 domain-containing protein [Alphaproteobacteria bacterium]
MSTAINWTCPYCNRPQTSISENRYQTFTELYVGENKFGKCGLQIESFACVNAECKELKITTRLRKYENTTSGRRALEVIDEYQLRPKGGAKPQPDFIPLAIRQDYEEACLIMNLSPKASATLARRCIQGMINDFCGIQKKTLNEEINELENKVKSGTAPKGIDEDTIMAINAIRSIGNIGAHMSKDIDLIIDIDPDEASHLIQLIENLFEDWYIAREKKRQNLEKISMISEDKKVQRISIHKSRQKN